MKRFVFQNDRINRNIRNAAMICLAVLCLVSGTANAKEDEICIGISASPEVFPALYTNMEILSELSSVEIAWNQSEDRNSTADSILYYVQEEIEKGTDGILICPPNDQVLPMICRMCEEANVYWGIYFRSIMDENIRAVCEASPYYIGNAYEDEETNAYLLTKKMLEQGYRKIALLSEAKWDTTCTAREKGINRALEETDGAEIVVEARDIRSEEDAAAMTRSILDAYPEVDCVYLAGSTIRKAPEIILDTILEERKDGSVGLVTIDFSQSLTEDFESGVLKAAFGVPQFSIDAYYMAVSMINTLKGFPLSEDAESYCVPGLLVESKEQAEEIADATENPDHLFFAEEEVETLLFKWNNPALNAEEFQRIIEENL